VTILIVSLLVTAGSVGIMWAYMCWISANRNGWDRLARTYRHTGPFDGSRFGLQSAIFNGFAFTGTLNLGVVRDGLYLRGGLLLRFFHPALVIPWSELRATRFDRSHSAGYSLGFKSFPEMSCEISDATCHRLSQALDPAWSVMPPWSRSSE